jgi:hypothetical protein
MQWEDPVRTLCSYIGALSILLGAHYLPLTQLALKAGAIALGGMQCYTCTISVDERALICPASGDGHGIR